jgi:hypothetical protein
MAAPSMSKVYLVQSRDRASSKGILAILKKKKNTQVRLSCLHVGFLSLQRSETVIKVVVLL